MSSNSLSHASVAQGFIQTTWNNLILTDKQAGAELGKAQVKLEVIVEVGVYFKLFLRVGVENEINANSAFN